MSSSPRPGMRPGSRSRPNIRQGAPRKIRSKRLKLRPVTLRDAKAVARLVNDAEIARNVSHIPHPYEAEDARRWIGALGEEAVFAVTRRWRLIGCVGLNPVSAGRAELGYWIGRKWWGRGFATEAAAAVLPYAFLQPDVELVTSAHFLDNPASGQVLRKLGFEQTGEGLRWCEARGERIASAEYSLSRAAFEARQAV